MMKMRLRRWRNWRSGRAFSADRALAQTCMRRLMWLRSWEQGSAWSRLFPMPRNDIYPRTFLKAVYEKEETRVRDQGHPCRTGARSLNRIGNGADFRDFDLRARGTRQA